MNNATILSAIIAFVATLIASFSGGLITFLLFALSPNNNVKSKRKETVFDAMDWTCNTLLECITNPNRDDFLESFKSIQDNIFLYGTKTEIKVISQIKLTLFEIERKKLQGDNRFYALLSLTLLINVIRCETYKKQIISDYIFKTYIKDYLQLKAEINSAYNELVNDFGLSSKYLIKNNKTEV